MKKTLLYVFCFLLFFCHSCMTKKQVTSLDAYKIAVAIINGDLSEMGYNLSASSQESKNDIYVSGTSYSRYTGYGTRWSNNFWQYDSFTYTDSLNNIVNFMVKYQMVYDEYIYNLDVVNCSANKNYDRICGNDGTIKTAINYLKEHPDKEVYVSPGIW